MGTLNTLLSTAKLGFIAKMLMSTRDVPGDIIEVGVFEGGGLFSLTALAKGWGKRFVGYDTFEGLPAPGPMDTHHKQGEFKSNFDALKKLFSDNPQVELIRGIFPDTSLFRPVSFCHLDVDFYKGTLLSLKHLEEHLSPGGIVVLDDVDYPNTPGVRMAVDAHLDSGKSKLKVHDGRGWQLALMKA